MPSLVIQLTQIVHIPVLCESYAQNKKYYKTWANISQKRIVLDFTEIQMKRHTNFKVSYSPSPTTGYRLKQYGLSRGVREVAAMC